MERQRGITIPTRGEVYLVNFDPTLGAEIRKTRPAVVIQNDVANRHSPVTIIAAITSRFENPLYPTEVFVRAPEGGLTTDGVVLLNQIRSVDVGRLVRRLGTLHTDTLSQVGRAIQISLGLVDLQGHG